MPNFIQIRRSDPEVGYMSVLNNSALSGVDTAVPDNVPVYFSAAAYDGVTVLGGATTYDSTETHYCGLVAGVMANNRGASTAHGVYGLCQIWGHHAAVVKDTTDTATAGSIAFVADDAEAVTSGGGDGIAAQDGSAIGIIYRDVASATAAEVFFRNLGV